MKIAGVGFEPHDLRVSHFFINAISSEAIGNRHSELRGDSKRTHWFFLLWALRALQAALPRFVHKSELNFTFKGF